MSLDLSAVPGTPAEFVELLLTADTCATYVHPFPPPSWLWTEPPYGWSIGTDEWNLVIGPRTVGGRPGLGAWIISYSDDDGNAEIVTIEHALDLVKLAQPWTT